MENKKVVLELSAEEAKVTMDALLGYYNTVQKQNNHQSSYIFRAHLDSKMFCIEQIADKLWSD